MPVSYTHLHRIMIDAPKDVKIVRSKAPVSYTHLDVYKQHSYLLEDAILPDAERNLFRQLDDYSKNTNVNKDISNEIIYRSFKDLAAILYRKFEKKVIILLDEYDTPMQLSLIHIS